MKSLISILVLSLFGHAALAQDSCMPTYTATYRYCKNAKTQITMENENTGWLLMKSQWTGPLSAKICVDALAEFAKSNPTASDPVVNDYEPREPEVALKGKFSYDIYCKFTYDTPVTKTFRDPSCGVEKIESSGCENGGLTSEFTEACLDSGADDPEQVWRKLACLNDSFSKAFAIRGMTPELYKSVQFNLQLFARAGVTAPAPVAAEAIPLSSDDPPPY